MTVPKEWSGKKVIHNRNKFITAQPEWMAKAACADTPVSLWFHDLGDAEKTRQAKDICYECPVRQMCLEWAFATGSNDGIFGGFDHKERRRLKRNAQRRRANQALANEIDTTCTPTGVP